ncbi:MAG: DUF72 domain-containing protein [Acidobacteriota bacterium]|nr:DUF72 domain-containing protein [Acidobacteriota bacterium]
MRLRIGTSGYSYKEWKGSFYPEDIAAGEMLRFYAGRFSTVEINNTFYRMPQASVLASWAEQVPDGFTFSLKASQRITHRSRLRDAEESVAFFFRVASTLGDRLGPVLFQLPPNLKKDLPRLSSFLPSIPAGSRAAFEFRHASWFDDEVYAALTAAGAALCIAEDEDLATPLVATTGWGYLRLRRKDYGPESLSEWAARIRGQAWTEAFVYFKHEDEARGPRFAEGLVNIEGA